MTTVVDNNRIGRSELKRGRTSDLKQRSVDDEHLTSQAKQDVSRKEKQQNKCIMKEQRSFVFFDYKKLDLYGSV
ncbi:hypothetical protein NECAME_00543 [Necator americanus]|uniref:Uncharacterized protein n=1 Tax=Necator americanus TaxID=51031 RepID=W2T7P3_NECAM|nr:hypothetical protein NECAME_00543 [Necator americanus]ETN77017.1 hypothetical protein NECAME_00543 [Necator americanus]